jgi:hypothetical protein
MRTPPTAMRKRRTETRPVMVAAMAAIQSNSPVGIDAFYPLFIGV